MQVERLRKAVTHALDNWNEVSMFSIAGVNNLSRADLDSLVACCDWFDEKGSLYGLRYFSPQVKTVLERFGGVVYTTSDYPK